MRAGQLADFALLSADYFAVPESAIAGITSVLTVLGGRVVHGSDEFAGLAPALPPALPDWSPARRHVGHAPRYRSMSGCDCAQACQMHGHAHLRSTAVPAADPQGFWGLLGCACRA